MNIKIILLIILFLIVVIFSVIICNGEVLSSLTSIEPYIFVVKWGSKGSENGEFNRPEKVAIDTEGNVYVVDVLNNRIQVFDSSGNFITKWGEIEGDKDGQFHWPSGVAVDSKNNVFVSDCSNDRIQAFDSLGNFITKWGNKYSQDNVEFYGPRGEQLDRPLGIAVDGKGNVFVKDCSQYIKKFESDGNFISDWFLSGGFKKGVFGDRSGFTSDISVDGKGNVYVIYWGQGIEIKDGVPLVESLADGIFCPYIVKYSSSGEFITKWGGYGEEDGKFKKLLGCNTDLRGNIYAVDSGNNRIQVFDSEGDFITKWGTSGDGDGEFNKPMGIAVDSEGNVYVVDSGNNRIQKFAPNPNFNPDN